MWLNRGMEASKNIGKKTPPNLPFAGEGTDKRPIRVRMAPSPTGLLHIGTARTTLFNLLFARHVSGIFVLRIEDTDKERSKPEYEKDLIDGLHWLGIEWDEGPSLASQREAKEFPISNFQFPNERGKYGPYRQSERTAIYRKYLEQLMADGNAYYCYCTKEELEAQKQDMAARGLPPKYNGHCRNLTAPPIDLKPEVIRFKTPDVKVVFKDMIRGNVEFDAGLFGDIVIAKNLDEALYNFAVVVDDELMEISHVIRGEDHIANTPKQILIERALGFREPIFAHLPLILNPDRSKMSKRFADTALADYRAKGYLPAAIVNFLALLGWHPQDDREFFTLNELIKEFDIARVQKSGAVFDQKKLDWLNREHLKLMDAGELTDLAMPFFKEAGIEASRDRAEKVVAAGQSRATTLRDLAEQGKFFFELPDYEPGLLVWKNMDRKDVSPVLHAIEEELSSALFDGFTREELSASLEKLSASRKKGEVFWPLRVALSGLVASPDPVEIMTVLGKDETIKRIEIAIKKMNT